jgi:CubicO group peptidase (beta-lactamase class C family)
MGVLDAVQSWPVGAAAAVMVTVGPSGQPGEPVTGATLGDDATAFRWASVTKLCTALAVGVAVEEGTLAFDEAAGPPGATVAHLLAHASGLGPDEGPPLMAPGRRRVYSNYGYEVLGAVLEAKSQLSFVEYTNEAILQPLGMRGARWETDGSPASGLTGTIVDLGALARELLQPTLISTTTHRALVSVAFGGLDGVLPGFGIQRPCDWGLGPEIRGSKQPHWTGRGNDPSTFGHFGQAGGFVWIDPVAGMALGALSDRPFGPWASDVWPAFSDLALTATDDR